MTDATNQRASVRRACDVAMEGAPGPFRCRALNASEGGLMIESPTPLAVGQRITLSLRGGDRSRAVAAEAEVVWTETREGLLHAGVRFLRKHEDFVV